MCGIVAVLRRPAGRTPPTAAEVIGAVVGLDSDPAGGADPASGLSRAADGLARADALLGGVPGLKLMLADRALAGALEHRLVALDEAVSEIEARLDAGDVAAGTAELEQLNHDLVRVRDGLWSLRRDRLGSARSVRGLIGDARSEAAVAAGLSVHQALAALDRLEVRGRDSAGLHLLVRGHGLDLGDPAVAAAVAARARDRDFGSGSVRLAEETASFVYKTAAEIGELGDNTAALRAAVRDDELLAAALAGDEARALVLAHTRWASVGIISEPNAHPLNSELIAPPGAWGDAPPDAPYVVGAVNGDIDNYADLMAAEEMAPPPAITTDSKAMPALMSRRLAAGLPAVEAFRRTVASFEGSVAVAACTAAAPGRLQLALRGSGQALYVGLAEDAYVVASEPYGLVEATDRYLRMDGETSANPDNPTAGRGQVVELDEDSAGELEGVSRWSYDSAELPVTAADVVRASITTRDIDRGDHPHYLLKELTQAPDSFRKTLRGKITDTAAGPRVSLGPEIIPDRLRDSLRSGSVNRVLAVGQGTAAVACESLAAALGSLAGGAVTALALPATELSGFGLRRDMSDTLVIAISQSGTTTDTNRTVDLVRSRGAAVIAIVNRRDSDLTERADGVLYTSDGRDVEMSVASTKAFYSQIAAGLLLAAAVAEEVAGEVAGRGAEEVAGGGAGERARLLDAVRALPAALEEVLATRPAIGEAARRFAPSRRHWAVVGSGSNRIAAREIRIKLSELCYKSISSDAIEDKKHIDLSSEPLVLVCAAGLTGSTAADAAKEVAIFRAHKAAPIVVADAGEERFGAALAVLAVPATDPQLSFVPAAMVGHLFGYEAALAIDAQAQPLREAHRALEQAAARPGATSEEVMAAIAPAVGRTAAAFSDGLRRGDYDGHLEASTAVRISTALRYALGRTPLDGYQLELGKVGTPTAVIEDLAAALGLGIAELSRPIDAIRHQAKTVTVGISRSDQALLQARLARAVIDAGAPRDQLAWSVLRTLADLDPAVAAVTGHTRYRVESLEAGDAEARLVVVDRGGISMSIPSRADRAPDLIGTKHLVAVERQVLVAAGRRDGRTVVLVPEVKNGVTTGITLLHVAFAERLSADAARGVLQGYRNRYSELRDAVTETEPSFREDLLAAIAPADLLTEPVSDLADRWRVSS